MLFLVPFFGNTAKFRPLLDRWFACARAAMPDLRPRESIVLLTDDLAGVEDACKAHGCGAAEFPLSDWRGLIRPEHPFDVKGALVASFVARHGYECLVLDADAFLAKDPRPLLSAYRDARIAMPRDHGAIIHYRRQFLDAPFLDVRKLCAGVQWFAGGQRGDIAAAYRRAYLEIVALPIVPWTPQIPHLVEQYAWSIAAHRLGAKVLPVTMNWHEDHLGPSEAAIVNHHYGHPKWKGVGAPRNV